MGIAVEILIILALILANGFLAMSEIAVVSSRKARLQQMAEEGDDRARTALKLAEDPNDFFSTVQIGITLVGILAGAFGGATIANSLADLLVGTPLAPYRNGISFGVVVGLITYFSLVIGELAPKRVAVTNPERIASSISGLMVRLSRITAPIVSFLTWSTNIVLKIIGVTPSSEPPVTEEEVKILLDLGTQAGVFEEAEEDMVAGVFRLADRRVGSIMTPRPEIFWLDLEDPIEVTKTKIIEAVHSRLPVAIGDLDHIQGIVQAKDLLSDCLTGESLDIRAALIEPQFVPESMPALKVLELFRESRFHIALVIDEFGGLQGLVTIIDILETIVGEFPGLGEVGEPEIVQRPDGSWLLDGMLPVDEFSDLFHVDGLPYAAAGHYQTLGGFVTAYLGRIPDAGDSFDWGGMHFEIMDMDGFRVDKVLVVPNPSESEARR